MTSSTVSVDLRKAAISGARWTGLARLCAEVLGAASSIVLARLISPAGFGDAVVALTVVGLTAVLGTAGCTALIVQRPELPDAVFAAVTAVTLSFAAAMTAMTIGVAELVVRGTLGGNTADLLLLASPAWLAFGVGAPSQAKLHREFRFRALAVIETAAALLGVGVALALGAAGAEGKAVVLGGVTVAACMGLFSLVAAPPTAWRVESAAIREAIAFGLPVTTSSLVYVAYRHVDYVILAARTTSTQVGLYWRGFQLGVDYQSKISQVMRRVSLPLYSRTGGLDELRRIRSIVVRTHAIVLVPLLAAFIAMAPDLVPFMFGDEWKPAVVPAQILAVAGMAEAVTTDVGPLAVAVGRPGQLVRWNLIQLVGYGILVGVLAPHGITTVAVGVAAFGVASVIGVHLLVQRPNLGVRFGDLAHEVVPAVVVGAAVLGAVIGVRSVLDPVDLPTPILLVAMGACALAVWIVVLRLAFHGLWAELVSIVARVGRRGPAAPRLADPSAPADGE